MDDLLRAAERRWRASQSWNDKLLYNVAMVRSGNMPLPDLEVTYLWTHQNVIDFRQSLLTHPRLTPDRIKWEPAVGTVMQRFRRWYFPNEVGLSATYNMEDPLPGRAPIIATVEPARHEMESVFFTYEEGNYESLDSAYHQAQTRQVITRPLSIPLPHFLSWSIERFLLSDESHLLRLLQVAGLGDLDAYKGQ